MNILTKKNFEMKKSPMLRDLPEVPHRKSKDLRSELKKMNVITKNPSKHHLEQSPGLNRSPKTPCKSPLKSPMSGFKSMAKLMKNSSKSNQKTQDEENDLKTEELGTNFVMEEKELNIMKFLEEENIVMANPKEKQFEYFESVKKKGT